jgi:pimeloyl-ACP methyl ester carboxylesterase
MLHSLDVNYNQYGALDPRTIQAECEDRSSICADTEGFGPGGWYFDAAEVDFWDVWHALAKGFTLDPNGTVISGYSMGGYATYKLGLAYPDLFAGAMALAGPPVCEVRVYGQVKVSDPGQCSADGDTGPLVGNARWLPYITDDGVIDELVPITGVTQQVEDFLQAGDRIDAEIYPAEDHLVYATQDAFGLAISHIGHPVRELNPPTISYAWYPDLSSTALGIGPTGVYWVRDLSARTSSPGTLASLEAQDSAIAFGKVTVADAYGADPTATPTPALTVDQTWKIGVAALTIDTARARLAHGSATVTTDGATVLTLSGVGRSVRVGRGTTTVNW